MIQSDITSIVTDLKIGVIIIDRETHNIEFVNEEAAELLQTVGSKLIGHRCKGLICPTVEGKCPVVDCGLTITREKYRFIRSDGSIIEILKTVRPFAYKGRDCLMETFLDYTDVRNFSDISKESEERMRLALAVGHEGIWDYDRWTGELYFDPNFYSMAGYENKSFPPDFEQWLKLVHEDDREDIWNELNLFLRGWKDSFKSEFKFLHRKGHYIWIRSIGEVVERDSEGLAKRLLGIHLDIDPEKARERRSVLLNSLQTQLLRPASLAVKCSQITKTIISAIQADFARIWIVGEADRCKKGCLHYRTQLYENYCVPKGKCLHLQASSGRYESLEGRDSRIPLGPHRIGSVFTYEKDIIIENGLEESFFIEDRQWAKDNSYQSFAGLKLTDSSGSRIGVLALFSTYNIDEETGGYLQSIAATTSQIVINERNASELKNVLQQSEKANVLMNGREIRIRQMKSEVNSLLGELGRGEKYCITDDRLESPVASPEEERLNALSLAEDAEIARRELMESNEQLSLIKQAVNFSSDAVAISTIKGDFFYVNSTFTQLFGQTPGRLAMESQDILFADPGDFNKALEAAEIGLSNEGESWLYNHLEEKIPVFIRSAPFRDSEGAIVGIVWNFTDITIRKRNEQKIRKDLDQQKEMLRKANILQQSYIQKTIPPVENFNIQGLFMPCEQLGGDFFKILRAISEEKLIIIMGDCTDHGLKASLDASLLSSVVDPHIKQLYEDERTDLFLNRVSRDFMKVADEDQYPTMMVMIIDLHTGIMFYSNANSELPYICRNGELEMLEKAQGMHIGYFDDPRYERKEFRFNRGDRLLLYSDAVTEIPDKEGRKQSRQLFEELVKSSRGSSSKSFYSLVRELENYCGEFPLEDDTTLIQLEYLPKEKYSFQFNDLKEWEKEQTYLKELLSRYDYALDERERISIAVSELVINAFVHGNQSDPGKTVGLKGEIDCSRLLLTIADEGEGFDPSTIPDPVLNIQEIMDRGDVDEYTHGRGLKIAGDFLTHVQWNSKGNEVTVTMNKSVREIITIETITLS